MKLYITNSGGGLSSIGKFSSKGGVSSWFEGLDNPYGTNSTLRLLRDTLGSSDIHGGKFCSKRAASHFATSGMKKLIDLHKDTETLVSIGSTFSLCSKGQREGRKSRGYISIMYLEGDFFISQRANIISIKEIMIEVSFDPKKGSCCEAGEIREVEETYSGEIVSKLINEIITPLGNITFNELYSKVKRLFGEDKSHITGCDPINVVSIESFKYPNFNDLIERGVDNIGVFSGSFNPIHDGHIDMAKNYQDTFPNNQVFFNIAIEHLFKDKLLSPYEINFRAEEIEKHGYKTICTLSGTFVIVAFNLIMKSGCHFIMGRDTFDKIPNEDLEDIRINFGAKIFLFDRKSKKELDYVDPLSYTQPQIKNISSTQIRNKGYEF